MLCRMNLHRLLEGQGRADRVRTADQLVPVRTVHEADILGRLQRCWVPFGFENHTGWIGQDHHRPRLRQRFADLLHDRHGDVDHVTESVEASTEALVRGPRRCAGRRGVDAGGVAPRPGAFDHGSDCVGWKSYATHELLPGVHDLALLERVWKIRGSLLRSHPTLSVSYAEWVVREPGVIAAGQRDD